VLVMPSRTEAYRGDRSAWLQYRPARLKDAKPKDSVTSPGGNGAGGEGDRAVGVHILSTQQLQGEWADEGQPGG
jgi:hypothetical protein